MPTNRSQNLQKGEHAHQPRKRFGQNFLVDSNVVDKIVSAISPKTNDLLVEIGPGKGAITELLAEAVGTLDEMAQPSSGSLTVIELDRDLVPWLQAKFEPYKNFHLHQADALTFDFSDLAQENRPLRVVGNLPYNISTPLIFHLLSYHQLVGDMHFMLQKEVVDRMGAQPGHKIYGRLSIMVQYYCQVDNLFPVPPSSFQPAPKVDSAIVRLIPYKEPPFKAKNIKLLERLVNVAFQQRRKTLRNALKQLLDASQLDQLAEQAPTLDTSLRPENLSTENFVSLSNHLNDIVSTDGP